MDRRAAVLMSGSELLSAYDAVHEQVAELEAYGAELLGRMEETGHAKEIGATDTARMIAVRYRLDAAEAHRRVKFAKALGKYAAVAAALPSPGSTDSTGTDRDRDGADGVVLHMGQARAIVSALEQLPASAGVSVEELVEAERGMVQAARHMSPSDLQAMGVQVRNILDTDGPEPREDAARQREDLWLKKTEDGVRFGGTLAAENAELLQTLVQAGAKPHKTVDGDPDPRSRGKRQADALVDVLNIAAGTGDLPTRGGIKPHITVMIDLDDLIQAGKNTTGDLTFGHGLSASAIRRLACDAGVIPVVLGSDSQPLDVGREARFVTDGLRNTLNQRDRGCVVCGAPPIYCDAHHLTSWLDGGVTSISNLVLLCRVHHTALHDGHWTIQLVDNQVQVSRPTWADPPPRSTRQPAPPSPPAAAHPTPPDADTRTTTDDAAPTDATTAPAPTTADTAPAATDTNTCTAPNADGATASPTNGTSNSPAAARTWPHTGNVPWMTPEEAAALNPWGDSTDTPSRTDDPSQAQPA
ncbi:HNH endonuclease signature motif containing protein [Kribbella catacumbae]|uniref:HNH endonuclease signature motif containing protein n=1 Tax=Kribbella catacumbae TaxID=460086 RepID=UPI001ED9A3C0|nr:HNH endonuclease signature motif containing protein [Kribbella catacumbae]